MIVPAFLMGGTFPLVARIYATDLGRVGGRIGTAYAFNTIGSILGSFLGSFVLLEVLGVEKGMLVVAVVYLAVGAVLVASGRRGPRPPGERWPARRSVALAGAICDRGLRAPVGTRRLMTSGVYVYAGMLRARGEGLEEPSSSSSGCSSTTRAPARRSRWSEPERPAPSRSTARWTPPRLGDMITQELIAHLPLLMHPRPDTVLVVGLGAG